MDRQAENQQKAWIATAKNLPSGVPRTDGSAPTPSTGESTALPALSASSLNDQPNTNTESASDQASTPPSESGLVLSSKPAPNTVPSLSAESTLLTAREPALSSQSSASPAATDTSQSIARRKDSEKRSASPEDLGLRSLDPSTLTTIYTSQIPDFDFQASTPPPGNPAREGELEGLTNEANPCGEVTVYVTTTVLVQGY